MKCTRQNRSWWVICGILPVLGASLSNVEAQGDGLTKHAVRVSRVHPLKALLDIQSPGEYPLSPAWTGIEEVTLRTGWITDNLTNGMYAAEQVRFNSLTLYNDSPKTSRFTAPLISEVRDGRRVCGSIARYWPILPTDEEMRAACEKSYMTNLFRVDPFPPQTTIRGWGARYFTLGPDGTIESMRFMYSHMNHGTPEETNSVVVKRGVFRREPGGP